MSPWSKAGEVYVTKAIVIGTEVLELIGVSLGVGRDLWDLGGPPKGSSPRLQDRQIVGSSLHRRVPPGSLKRINVGNRRWNDTRDT